MKTVPRELVSFIVRQRNSTTLLCAVLTLLAAKSLQAQDVLMSNPSKPQLPAVLRQSQPPPPVSHFPSEPGSPFNVGPISFNPSLTYSYTSATGLPAVGGGRVSSDINRLTLGLEADLGQYWSLSYHPTWNNYSSPNLRDRTSQSMFLQGAYDLKEWSLRATQRYSRSNSTLIETAQQTEQKNWGTSLGATYRINEHFHFESTGDLQERRAEASPDLKSWSFHEKLNWLPTPRLVLSLDPSYQYNEIKDAPDTEELNYRVHLTWLPVEKVTVGLGGGIQRTHSTASRGQDHSNPLIDAMVSYHPLETTTLSLGIVRSSATSLFQNRIIDRSSWNIGLEQRLLGHLYLEAKYNHDKLDYLATTTALTVERLDTVESYEARLTTKLFKRFSLSAIYLDRQNRSNLAAFSFSSRQVGLELGIRY